MAAEEHKAEFIGALKANLERGAFVKLTLGKYRGREEGLKNVYVRRVEIRGAAHLSFLMRYRTRDVVKNYLVTEGVSQIGRLLGADFLSGHLFTVEKDLEISFNRKGEARLAARPPTFTKTPPVAHDRARHRFVELEGNLYLRALGVTNERGEVRDKMGDKFRQINKFVEIVSGLFDSSRIRDETDISIVDMGSGKGSLTFAVYDFFNRTRRIKADVTGIEARPELVEKCNAIARAAGFDRLRFETGYIRDYTLGDTDILIALHACDTATDDAIFKGIVAKAEIIITAPCCHREIRPQIQTPTVLRPVLRHGILLEREAETITDSLRALLLEQSGYTIKVFEFISTEHTRKNTMITALRRDGARDREATLQQIEALKKFYGLREQHLERLLRQEGKSCAT